MNEYLYAKELQGFMEDEHSWLHSSGLLVKNLDKPVWKNFRSFFVVESKQPANKGKNMFYDDSEKIKWARTRNNMAYVITLNEYTVQYT